MKGDGSDKDLGRLGDIDDTIPFLKLTQPKEPRGATRVRGFSVFVSRILS